MMMAVKSYRQFCSVARTLDVIGDRWALLVVRELQLGPRRYSDLLHGLPGVGTNVLATRLRELEEAGIVARRQLPAPTPATVYELTEDGEDLRGVVDSLAQWGARRMTHPAKDDTVEPRWLVGLLAATVDASRCDDGATFALRVDHEPFTLSVDAGRLTASHGEPTHAVATLVGALRDFFAAVKGDRAAARRIKVDGDRSAGRMLVAEITGTNV
jgi:DNA-binding HxlR family transcriptional regulator